jgi:GxxExxY protein
MPQIIHKELSYTIRGVLLKIYNDLGPMLPENFYRDAAAFGLEARKILCSTEKPFEVYYRNTQVGFYLVDVWVETGPILIEFKVAPEITALHHAQAISYLKVTNADLAIVANYGADSLLDERLPNFLRDKTTRLEWQAQRQNLPKESLYPELTARLLELLHRVHFELGPGFLHQIYRRATMVELKYQGLKYEYIKQLPIRYEGHQLGMQPVRLIQVEDKVLLATIAVKETDQAMQLQLKARLRHLGLKLGMLANFNAVPLQVCFVRL